MRALDWVIVAVYLVYVLVDGVRRAEGTREIEGYFLANRSLPWWAVALLGVPTVIYTMIGGVQAVTWVDVKQMGLIVFALIAVMVTLLVKLPVAPDHALALAGAAGRLRTFDFSFDLTNDFTFWSGLIGGTFLMLSYYGTDQSQVQRYITAKSVDQARSSPLIRPYL